MVISSVKLTQFRNYFSEQITFHEGINALVGLNGMGKTNVLDAIYYLCLGKSYFSSVDKMVVMQEKDFFRIEGVFDQNGTKEVVVIKSQLAHKKEIEISGKNLERIGDLVGRFLCVIIAPADIQNMLEGSEERRQFLNNTIVQTNKEYLDDLILYSNLLKRRNALLKTFAEKKFFDPILLESITVGMYEPAQRIHSWRKIEVEKMLHIFSDTYAEISGSGEKCEILYQSQLENKSLEDLMTQNLDKDKLLARTTQGIHKDDLIFTMNDQPLKYFASQGQLKSFVLALKLSQYKIIEANAGKKPILLLDDIFDKLDQSRVRHLLTLLLRHQFGQVIMTDTFEDRITGILDEIQTDYRIFTIDKGTVKTSIH